MRGTWTGIPMRTFSSTADEVKIGWYENLGEGDFSSQQVITTSSGEAWSVYAQDLDGDADIDILAAFGLTGKIVWYKNLGGGDFSDEQVVKTSAGGPRSVHAQDLDGDSDADILSASVIDDKVVWYENQGGGTFSSENVITEADGAESVYARDLDGDSDADVLSASSVDDKIAWYENEGDGTFSEQQVITTNAEGAESVYAQDLDEDGDADVLSASSEDDKVAWYENQGGSDPPSDSLSFTEANADLTPVVNSSTSIADVNEDGNQDLLITGFDPNGEESSTLYLGNGQGDFSRADADLTGFALGSTSIGDVDKDGNLDLLITGNTFEPTTLIYLGNGQGDFSSISLGPDAGVDISSTSISDVDGNGNPDLLITGRNLEGDPSSTLYLGNGEGDFTEAEAGLTGVQRSSTSIADVDGDGNPDLLITGEDPSGSRTTTLYLGDGQGDFTEANADLTPVSSGSSTIADVDGDGNLDLLVTGDSASMDQVSTLYLGNGQGGFAEANAGLNDVGSGSNSIADVDGDGNLDLLITGWDGSSKVATLYLGDGQGEFTEVNAGLNGTGSGSASIGEMNGDESPDLLITGWDGSSRVATAYLNQGEGDSPPRQVTLPTP